MLERFYAAAGLEENYEWGKNRINRCGCIMYP